MFTHAARRCSTRCFASAAASNDAPTVVRTMSGVMRQSRYNPAALFKRLLILAVLIVVAITAYEWLTFPDVSVLAKEMPKTTAFMDRRRAELRAEGKDDTLSYRPVPYSRISPYLRRAVLVAEDNTFYEHGATDVRGMKEAIEKDWEHKRLTNGGSTITQQLAKNLYLSSSRNPLRKIDEYFIARALEDHLTKKRILEIY